jgi:transcriptional regulator with XRE-family HTH domain
MYVLYIKKFRLLRRLTQEELSFKSGIDASYISRLEAENTVRVRSPKLNIIRDLAIGLQICPMDIIFYKCISCEQFNTCKKKQYLGEDYFKDNIIYYL